MIFLLTTPHRDSRTSTDVKPEMEFHMINMMYAALPMRAQTEKTTFSCNDDCILTKRTRCLTYSPLRLQYDHCRTSLLPGKNFLTPKLRPIV